jgi:hypothetical protein
MNRMLLSIDRTRSAEYATADDFQRLLASEMTNLFHLALLLTADSENAESCVIFAIRDCMSVNSVYKEWMRVWARRAVVRNAIRIAAESPANSHIGNLDGQSAPSTFKRRCRTAPLMDESAGILRLGTLERLVYVICAIEHYPVRDCALLLGRSQQDVLNAWSRASDQIAAFERAERREAAFAGPNLRLVLESEPGEIDGSCGTLLD